MMMHGLTNSKFIVYVLRFCVSAENPILRDHAATRSEFISIYQVITATVPSCFYL